MGNFFVSLNFKWLVVAFLRKLQVVSGINKREKDSSFLILIGWKGNRVRGGWSWLGVIEMEINKLKSTIIVDSFVLFSFLKNRYFCCFFFHTTCGFVEVMRYEGRSYVFSFSYFLRCWNTTWITFTLIVGEYWHGVKITWNRGI